MIAKFKYLRSKPLMELYRKIPCQRCGVDDGTVCGAHSNLAIHGKGRGIKASDEFCASLCHQCHAWLDFGSAIREEKTQAWNDAHTKTLNLLAKVYPKEYLKACHEST